MFIALPIGYMRKFSSLSYICINFRFIQDKAISATGFPEYYSCQVIMIVGGDKLVAYLGLSFKMTKAPDP